MNNTQTSAAAKVLYTALARMTSDRTIIRQAFAHWLTTLADQPFDVINVVSSLEKFLGLSTQERKVLMTSLHAAANRAESELSAVPDFILGDSQSIANAGESPTSAQLVRATKKAFIELTEKYFESVVSGVRKVNAKDYSELNSVIANEGLNGISSKLNKSVQASVSDRLDLPTDTTEQECQELCHELYLLVADFIGPREADGVSDRVITELLNSTAASSYDPRKLL